MKTLKIKDDIHWVGALDPDLRIFDIVMHTEFGTTYNSYLVKGSEKTALFETVKAKCFDDYLERLKTLTDINNIDYIVVDHTEPDHAGSIEMILEYSPNAKIVGSNSAIRFLKAIVNKPFEAIAVNTGDTISLGNKTLEFISAPFLHWPDSIYTYIKEDKTLITCDSFGSHYCFEEVLNEKITNKDDYMKALRYYYDMIMGPFKPYVLEAISKIRDKEIDIICPGHGPVLNENPWEIVDIYEKWSTEVNPNTKKTVIIPYVSAYGYTETLAKKIAEGIETEGDIDVKLYDMVYADMGQVMGELYWADGFLLGSPTINGDVLPPIWSILTSLNPIVHGKKFAASFGSYGWSGEAVYNIDKRLKELRMKITQPGLRINFKPSEDELQSAFDFGKDFVEKLTKKKEIILAVSTQDVKKKPVNDSGEMKKWKCLVCNEVFDGVEPPDICPACGATHEQFEEFIEEKVEIISDAEENFVIVGNNGAGLSAAEAIRKRNLNANIKVITAESAMGYYRPMLSEYISTELNDEEFYLHDEKWYEENKIDVELDTTINKIDPEKKKIFSENKEFTYDKLILANGSRSFVPPISDVNKTGVFTLKNLKDAIEIKDYAKKSEKCVVIGGGLLGLEAAWELKLAGLDVTVLEMENRILPRQLDEESSCIFEESIIKSGISLMKGVSANVILGGDKVSGVQLLNGDNIDCDLVIVSAGVRANIGILEGTDISTNRGIVVNEMMETSAKDIYAAGDVAEFNGMNIAIWPIAIEQGSIAGANAAGDSKEYKAIRPSNIFNGMNTEVFSIGDINPSGDDIKTIKDTEAGSYKKMFFKDGMFIGGILIGDIKKSGALIKALNKPTGISEIVEDVILG